jgi:transcriptional regulator with XRE-family HTH domain
VTDNAKEQAPPRGRRKLYQVDHVAARQAREQAGLTQRELADKAGVSTVTVNRMEAPGNRFRLSVLVQVARVLDTAERSPALAALLGQR